ncbi:unnamed protein product, partial [Prorocentrum cordatum]
MQTTPTHTTITPSRERGSAARRRPRPSVPLLHAEAKAALLCHLLGVLTAPPGAAASRLRAPGPLRSGAWRPTGVEPQAPAASPRAAVALRFERCDFAALATDPPLLGGLERAVRGAVVAELPGVAPGNVRVQFLPLAAGAPLAGGVVARVEVLPALPEDALAPPGAPAPPAAAASAAAVQLQA